MGVLVSIQMRDHNAGPLQLPDLGDGLCFHLITIDTAADGAHCEAAETLIKAPVVRPSVRERGSLFSAKHWGAVHEHDMAADAHPGHRGGALARIIECLTVGHEGCGGYDTVAMGFDNGAVHSLSQPEIIRIDDQTSHASV